MPKEKKIVGRKECMEAMCHRCQHFNAFGAVDCERQSCPLYAFNPLAKLEPTVSWTRLKTGKAVGFVPKKGVSDVDFAASVESAVAYNYGYDLATMPAILQEQRDKILGAVSVPNDERTEPNDSDDAEW